VLVTSRHSVVAVLATDEVHAVLTNVRIRQRRPKNARTIRYDTVRYGRLACAQKLTGMVSLIWRTAQKRNKIRKKINKNRVAQNKRSRQRSVEAVRKEEVKLRLREVGFVKEVGFKRGVKERGSYRCTEW